MIRVLLLTVVKEDLAGLQRTVRSISSQSYLNLHHFIINGGDDSITDKYLTELASNESKVSFLTECDNGIYSAMNKWNRYPDNFDLICWINAGDIFESTETINRVVNSFCNSNWKWFYGNVRVVNYHGETKNEFFQIPFKRRLFELGLRWIPHGSVFMTYEILGRVGKYREDLGVGADQEFLFRVAKEAEPKTTTDIIFQLEDGGAHTTLKGLEREKNWHNFRYINKRLFLNSRILDFSILPILLMLHKIQFISRFPRNGRSN